MKLCKTPFVMVALILAAIGPARAEIVSGAASVIDGRTLEVGGRTVRLWGIDSPDIDQSCTWGERQIPCGRLAKGAMMDLIIGASVRCEAKGTEGQSFIVAVCYADSYDIGANLIHTGWALAKDPTNQTYRNTEAKARAARRGLWRGKFELPAVWRQGTDGRD